MKKAIPDFLEILRTLCKHEVDFIIVGGVCGVLHGAPVATFDLDLVHSRAQDNLSRLMAALEELGAYYRGRGEQRLRPGPTHLASAGHQLLMTEYGPLDLLGTIGVGHSYEGLLKEAVVIEVGGLRLRVLGLEALIRVKKETITEKDKVMIRILQHTLAQRAKKED